MDKNVTWDEGNDNAAETVKACEAKQPGVTEVSRDEQQQKSQQYDQDHGRNR